MVGFLTGCRFNPTLGGLTDWTYSSAVTGYANPTAAGAINGELYRYRAENAALTEWEIGYGTYNLSTGVFTRSVIALSSTGVKVNFSTVPQVAITFLAGDLADLPGVNGNVLSPIIWPSDDPGECDNSPPGVNYTPQLIDGGAEQYCALSANFTLSNVATAQKAFNNSTNGAVTLDGNTLYEFEGEYFIADTGATLHSWGVLFAGTATITSGIMEAIGNGGTAASTALMASSSTLATSMIATQVFQNASNSKISIKGRVRINAGGTFIPQVQASAIPGVAPVMGANSMFRIWPIGIANLTSVGRWS